MLACTKTVSYISPDNVAKNFFESSYFWLESVEYSSESE